MIAPPLPVHVQILVEEPGRQFQCIYQLSPNETLADLYARVASEHQLTGLRSHWTFRQDALPLPWSRTVGDVATQAGNPELLHLVLCQISTSSSAGGDWSNNETRIGDLPLPSGSAQHRMHKSSAPAPAPAAAPVPIPAQSPVVSAPAGGAVVFSEEAYSDQLRSRSAKPAAKMKRAVEDSEEADADLDEMQKVTRQATVRYYHRMNPQRVYPFLVVLSAEEIAEIVQKGVKQNTGDRFEADTEEPIEIEPVLPGCQVYPPKHTLIVESEAQSLEFWVVPQVLGTIQGAKVIVRQHGKTLSEVKLQAKVVKQTAAMVVGAMSFIMPYVTKGLKGDNPDNSPIQGALNWVADHLRPEMLFGVLMILAFLLYLWCRPRKRDLFWDVNTKG